MILYKPVFSGHLRFLVAQTIFMHDRWHLGSNSLQSLSKYKIVTKGKFAYATIHLDEGSLDFMSRDEVAAISPMYTVFSVDSKQVDNYFLKTLLKSPKLMSIYQKIGKGTVNRRKSISFSSLSQIELILPPLKEQLQIVERLSSIDIAIEKAKAVIEQTKRLKQGLLQELLTRGIGHTKFKMTEIGEIPESWEVGSLGKYAEICNSGRKPINLADRQANPGPYPYYGPTKAMDGINEFKYEGEYVLIGEDGDHFLKFKTWSMTQLVVGKFNVNNHAHVLQGKNECSTNWIFHYFRHRDITRHLTRQGAGRYKLRKTALIDLLVACPPIEEQAEIAKNLEVMDEEIIGQMTFLSSLLSIKAGVSAELLSGTKRVVQ